MAVRSSQQLRLIAYNADADARLTSIKAETAAIADPDARLTSIKAETAAIANPTVRLTSMKAEVITDLASVGGGATQPVVFIIAG